MDFEVVSRGEASLRVEAPAEAIWGLLADLARTGEWSPECTGGRWLGGADGPAPGARFLGFNRKGPLWWYTRSKVVACEPGRLLSWEVTPPGSRRPVSRWTWRIEPDGTGAMVTESFEIGRAPRHVRASWLLLNGSGAGRMEALQRGLQASLERVKRVAETDVAATD